MYNYMYMHLINKSTTVIQVSKAGRTQNKGQIAPLNSNRKSLQQIVQRVRISSNLLIFVIKLPKGIGP